MNFLEKLEQAQKNGQLPNIIAENLRNFYYSYIKAGNVNHEHAEVCEPVCHIILDEAIAHVASPFEFSHFHQKIREPIDFHRFGIDFVRPMIDLETTQVLGMEQVDEIETFIKKGDNVVLFANHQTEPDPQSINYLLEKSHPKLIENLIFIAGHRVTADPLAVPLSKGLNLLCIYSKNYIETPPEEKSKKLLYNQSTIRKLRQILTEGGKCIYVAPSGGRDRPNKNGKIEVAPFNPDSIEMFRLTASHTDTPTHFYPLALYTNNIFPPPTCVCQNLGEPRLAKCAPIFLSFGPRIDINAIASDSLKDKKKRRSLRADYIWSLVKELYDNISTTTS